jgi:hypothetical protein
VAGLADTADTTLLRNTKDGGATCGPARIGYAAIPGVCSIEVCLRLALGFSCFRDRIQYGIIGLFHLKLGAAFRCEVKIHAVLVDDVDQMADGVNARLTSPQI